MGVQGLKGSEAQMVLVGFKVYGFWSLGFRVLGFRVVGFRLSFAVIRRQKL